MDELNEEERSVYKLIEKAEHASDANNALKFSQAATNCANALSALQSIKLAEKQWDN